MDNTNQNTNSRELINEDESESEQQQQQVVPVIEEEYSISKETITKEAKIEKRWITKAKTIKVPITYEEVFINGRKMKSVRSSEPWILSILKDKIGSSMNSHNATVKQSILKKSEIKDDQLVPFSSDEGESTTEIEKVIPIMGEEIEVIKKMVKLAEIVIRKRQITENKKVDIDIKKEKVIIEYPDGSTNELTEQ
jgi:stress response protein YsnF